MGRVKEKEPLTTLRQLGLKAAAKGDDVTRPFSAIAKIVFSGFCRGRSVSGPA
jgi:hypothetical protein